MNCQLKNNKDYISIVVPVLNRWEYVDPLIDSIILHSDFPYELIIHDDGSDSDTIKRLLSKRNDISSLILNNGRQLGLAGSANRCIDIAGSNYILFMNADCVINRPCFKEIKSVLDKQYVGYIGLLDSGQSFESIKTEYGSFSFKYGVGSGAAMAFTKELYELTDGFDDMVRSGCADSPIGFKCWYNGYFRISLNGDACVRNVSQELKGNSDSQMGKSGFDCGMPKIFNAKSYDAWCRERWEMCEDRFRDMENNTDNEGNIVSDMNYWHNYTKSVIGENGYISKINWNKAMKYGQDHWKQSILRDFIESSK